MKKFREPDRSRARQRQVEVKRKHPTGLDGARGSKERQISVNHPKIIIKYVLSVKKNSF